MSKNRTTAPTFRSGLDFGMIASEWRCGKVHELDIDERVQEWTLTTEWTSKTSDLFFLVSCKNNREARGCVRQGPEDRGWVTFAKSRNRVYGQ
eukprot:3339414-Rhodomonas_salina.1